jgi:hypothetical protein
MAKGNVISELSTEQEFRLVEICENWRAVALDTSPLDKDEARSAIDALYEAAGLEPPEMYLWLDSPIEAAMVTHLIAREENFGRPSLNKPPLSLDVINEALDQHRLAALRNQLGKDGFQEHWLDQVPIAWRLDRARHYFHDDQVMRKVSPELMRRIRVECRKVQPDFETPLLAELHKHDRDGDDGYLWRNTRTASNCHKLAAIDFLRSLKIKRQQPINEMFAVARTCGWWAGFEYFAIVTPKPRNISLDEWGNLHSTAGMAVEYRDGRGLYAFHGIPLPARSIEDPRSMTISDIVSGDDSRAEVILIQQYGWERFVKDAGLELVHQDQISSENEDIPVMRGGQVVGVRSGREVASLYRASELTDAFQDSPMTFVHLVDPVSGYESVLRVGGGKRAYSALAGCFRANDFEGENLRKSLACMSEEPYKTCRPFSRNGVKQPIRMMPIREAIEALADLPGLTAVGAVQG